MSNETANGTQHIDKLPVPQSRRDQNSLADDSTAVTPPSLTSKQPSEYQVITESCEWCMETAPWSAEDEEDTNTILTDTMAKKTATANMQQQQQVS